ncbi:hypothetical protein [Halorarius halobius]|uniref:hypothetical protein n=1 Tax=Halorarius halobius TaxID=2962671 RepID=UPI0020CD1229|nr:hypothetical protein [Halorarius halobius]
MKPSIALSEVGELAGLTVVGWLLALVAGGTAVAAATVLFPDTAAPLLVAAVLAPLVGLYLLFGAWDWRPGGETRQHATFLAGQLGLWLLVGGVGLVVPASGVGRWLLLLAALFATPLAGWLAYLGGVGRLRRAVGGEPA